MTRVTASYFRKHLFELLRLAEREPVIIVHTTRKNERVKTTLIHVDYVPNDEEASMP
ncbi:MAG: hypothetical protein JOZ41_05015 [Chloroflexi bacterium]|nr:hypothetical protein [Chloroflexota bacterium]